MKFRGDPSLRRKAREMPLVQPDEPASPFSGLQALISSQLAEQACKDVDMYMELTHAYVLREWSASLVLAQIMTHDELSPVLVQKWESMKGAKQDIHDNWNALIDQPNDSEKIFNALRTLSAFLQVFPERRSEFTLTDAQFLALIESFRIHTQLEAVLSSDGQDYDYRPALHEDAQLPFLFYLAILRPDRLAECRDAAHGLLDVYGEPVKVFSYDSQHLAMIKLFNPALTLSPAELTACLALERQSLRHKELNLGSIASLAILMADKAWIDERGIVQLEPKIRSAVTGSQSLPPRLMV